MQMCRHVRSGSRNAEVERVQRSRRMKKGIRTVGIVAVWLLLWQFAARQIGQPIVFVGPVQVCRALAVQVTEAEFWMTVLHSSAKICGGFLIAFTAGVFGGMAAGRFRLLAEFLEPAVGCLQAVPVASFVILALIWIGSENLSVLISFLVVFPVIYRNTLAGVRCADPKLLEMAQVYRMGTLRRFRCIYWPALFPHLFSGSQVALAMAWKSGVAAEVIGVPDLSIGEKLYMAKIYLSTAELFAWTLVIILVSRLFELLFLRLLSLLDVRRGCAACQEASE